jgi:DNA-binding Lrp family transcriptional regulator
VHLPPSAKLVYKVLEKGGRMTQKDLVRETALPSRTVRYALARLREEDILVEHLYIPDARQSLYGISPTPREASGMMRLFVMGATGAMRP